MGLWAWIFNVSKMMAVVGLPWISKERDLQVLSEGNLGRHGTSVILQCEKFWKVCVAVLCRWQGDFMGVGRDCVLRICNSKCSWSCKEDWKKALGPGMQGQAEEWHLFHGVWHNSWCLSGSVCCLFPLTLEKNVFSWILEEVKACGRCWCCRDLKTDLHCSLSVKKVTKLVQTTPEKGSDCDA